MKKFTVLIHDTRDPQVVPDETFTLEASLPGEASEKASTLFFTKHAAQVSQQNHFEVRLQWNYGPNAKP